MLLSLQVQLETRKIRSESCFYGGHGPRIEETKRTEVHLSAHIILTDEQLSSKDTFPLPALLENGLNWCSSNGEVARISDFKCHAEFTGTKEKCKEPMTCIKKTRVKEAPKYAWVTWGQAHNDGINDTDRVTRVEARISEFMEFSVRCTDGQVATFRLLGCCVHLSIGADARDGGTGHWIAYGLRRCNIEDKLKVRGPLSACAVCVRVCLVTELFTHMQPFTCTVVQWWRFDNCRVLECDPEEVMKQSPAYLFYERVH
jgi:hypothetical protein